MLTTEEQKFIDYWQEKRKQNKLNPFLFGQGFAVGLVTILLIHFCVVSGWNKQVPINLNLAVMPLVYIGIVTFCAWFYNSFKYEQNEQLYQEFLIKKKRSEKKEDIV